MSHPWDGIAAGIVNFESTQLSYTEALASPCAACPTSPCCTHLPLRNLKIADLIDLDHLLYVLNFNRIELGLSSAGDWSIYYVYPCRYLNRHNFNCDVHNSPEQPEVCVHYNPYHCKYKRVFTQSMSDDLMRIDRQRMEFIVAHIVFDEQRNIVAMPSWQTLVNEFRQPPNLPSPQPAELGATDVMTTQELATVVSSDDGEAGRQTLLSYGDMRDACTHCQAYCCKVLVFPLATPDAAFKLDFYRFCLGFPGVELGISSSGWTLVVNTTCRYLKDDRCSVYGETAMPLMCKYYDAWKCTYKKTFGTPRPTDYLRVRLEQFDALTQSFQFDQNGTIVQMPSMASMKKYVEDCSVPA